MFKKIILLLFISSLVVSGFAQKSKRKTSAQPPKSSSFVMLVNGETTLKESYCPDDTILFDFVVLDTNIKNFTYRWLNDFHNVDIMDSTPIKLTFPITANYPNISNYSVSLRFDIPSGDSTISEILTTIIPVDYIRTILDTMVCEGRNITVTNSFGELITFSNVHGSKIVTPWDTLQSVSGCDSLVRWDVEIIPYIEVHHKISSCDSIIWGSRVIKRPENHEGDYADTVQRVFLVHNPENYCCDCDTLRILAFTIIDVPILKIVFDSIAFCAGEDMLETIEIETNFTAFDWRVNKHKYRVRSEDSTFTSFEPFLHIEYSGHFEVWAYMDTSLYDTLRDLRIVNNCSRDTTFRVDDCPLIIPNVITPNDDGFNDWLGIRKLNPYRENELVIYDRWGKNVFSAKNYKCVYNASGYHNTEEAFKGEARGGRPLPDGTYYYAFIYDAIPEKIKYTGTIVILRD